MATSRPACLPGVLVVRFEMARHLCRVVPSHAGTVLHLAGCSEWTLLGRRYSSRPGTLDVKVPGEVYAERARHGEARFQVVLFEEAVVSEAREALGRAAAPPSDNAFDGGDARVGPIVALHRRLLDARSSAPLLEQSLCDALGAFVELTSRRRGARSGAGDGSTAVARARALLDARLTDAVTLEELSAHARLDKFHLTRAFRRQVGLPPHAYVTHRRVALAQTLLARGVPQADVALKVGFYDQSQLHRHFKRILGLTPGAYARAVR